MGPSENIFDNFTCYLLSQGVTCYVLSGFRNSSLISIHIIIQLPILLSFSKYIRLRQYYEFPFILRDLRHIYQWVLRQLRTQLPILLSFSKYIRLRQYYEFPFILRDLRHIYQWVLRQLRTKSKTRAMIAKCKFLECVVGRKFSWKTVCRNVKNCRFDLFRFLGYQMNYHQGRI